MNYGELKTAISSFLWNRSDITAAIPTWILMAEAQMNRRLTDRLMVLRSDATISTAFVELPDDYAGVVSIKLADTEPKDSLDYVSPEAADRLDEIRLLPSGRPQYYTIIGSQLRLLPAPDADYLVEMTYRRQVAPLTADADTNWVLTRHPDAYLYGALMQSAPWLREDDRVGMWGDLYATIMSDIINQADVAATLQMQPSTTPVE